MRHVYVLLFCLVCIPLYGATLEVGPGKTYSTIQDAINASSNGDRVLVYNDTYTENIRFYGKEITVQSNSGYENCVIDGGSVGPCVRFDYGEDNDSILDGFTLTNGYGEQYYDGPSYYRGGGGVYCYLSGPVIKNNYIVENEAPTGGFSAVYGGGIYVGYQVIPNRSMTANNDYEPVIQNNIIEENFASYGGGIYIEYDNGISGSGFCTVKDNYVYANYGLNGIGLHVVYGTGIITRNQFYKNGRMDPYGWETDTGCVVFDLIEDDLLLTNNMIGLTVDDFPYNNMVACDYGLYLRNTGNVDLINNTFIDCGSDYCLKVKTNVPDPDTDIDSENNIYWLDDGSTSDVIYLYTQYSGTIQLDIDYCDVEDGSSGIATSGSNITVNYGGDNISVLPSFVNYTEWSERYHLNYDCDCIDAGNNSAPNLPTVDYDGEARIQWGEPPSVPPPEKIVDIGADEHNYFVYGEDA